MRRAPLRWSSPTAETETAGRGGGRASDVICSASCAHDTVKIIIKAASAAQIRFIRNSFRSLKKLFII